MGGGRKVGDSEPPDPQDAPWGGAHRASAAAGPPTGWDVGGGDGGPALPPNAELVQSQACTGDRGVLPRLPQAPRPLWAVVPGASLAWASVPWPHPPWLPTPLGLPFPPGAVASALFSVPTLTLCLGLQGWGRLLEEPGGIVSASGCILGPAWPSERGSHRTRSAHCVGVFQTGEGGYRVPTPRNLARLGQESP